MSSSCIQILRFSVRGIDENDWLPLVVILHKARNTRCEEVSTSLKRAGLLNVGVRDRSFFMREGGGLVGLGGGPLEKNWLERGGQPKKNEGKGGSDEKIRLKIG